MQPTRSVFIVADHLIARYEAMVRLSWMREYTGTDVQFVACWESGDPLLTNSSFDLFQSNNLLRRHHN
jgi:hypothetical protein